MYRSSTVWTSSAFNPPFLAPFSQSPPGYDKAFAGLLLGLLEVESNPRERNISIWVQEKQLN